MRDNKDIILMIKKSIGVSSPNAIVILYGSYARGDNRENSDLDLLILIDKEKVTIEDKKKVKYPLYDIEFETGQIISPLVFSKKDWKTRHRITPLYENIQKKGVFL